MGVSTLRRWPMGAGGVSAAGGAGPGGGGGGRGAAPARPEVPGGRGGHGGDSGDTARATAGGAGVTQPEPPRGTGEHGDTGPRYRGGHGGLGGRAGPAVPRAPGGAPGGAGPALLALRPCHAPLRLLPRDRRELHPDIPGQPEVPAGIASSIPSPSPFPFHRHRRCSHTPVPCGSPRLWQTQGLGEVAAPKSPLQPGFGIFLARSRGIFGRLSVLRCCRDRWGHLAGSCSSSFGTLSHTPGCVWGFPTPENNRDLQRYPGNIHVWLLCGEFGVFMEFGNALCWKRP